MYNTVTPIIKDLIFLRRSLTWSCLNSVFAQVIVLVCFLFFLFFVLLTISHLKRSASWYLSWRPLFKHVNEKECLLRVKHLGLRNGIRSTLQAPAPIAQSPVFCWRLSTRCFLLLPVHTQFSSHGKETWACRAEQSHGVLLLKPQCKVKAEVRTQENSCPTVYT